ncbi:YhcH/YjgK/YiaL family protein [Nitrospirota bacterium]
MLEPGIFAVFFPQDVHVPQVASATGSGTVTKVVIKLKTTLL